MTAEDRMDAIAAFGFTPRQARFLTFVIRHAGICLLRQYATFASIVQGQNTRAFFQQLVTRGYATAYSCRHNRGRIYHVHHFALYRAVGEPNSAHRRPIPANRVAERLMLLDAVLASPELDWLATDTEKLEQFTGPSSVPVEKLPRLRTTTGPGQRHNAFPDKLPIGIATDGRPIFVFLVRLNAANDFRSFLRRHRPLFQTLPTWTLRLVFPRAAAPLYQTLHAVVREELESPLHPHTVDELKWYFEQLRAMKSPRVRPADDRFIRAADAFERPRFYALYQRWLKDGDRALEDVSSTLISDALAAGSGQLECLVLPHRYDHLSPVIDVIGLSARGAEKRAEKSDEGGDEPSARPRPLFDTSMADANSMSLV
jgi:hypothetical protein